MLVCEGFRGWKAQWVFMSCYTEHLKIKHSHLNADWCEVTIIQSNAYKVTKLHYFYKSQ